MTKHIALYGKAGVGKTTLATNISAALVEAGFNVLGTGAGHEEMDRSGLEQINPDYVIHDISGDHSSTALHSFVSRQDMCRLFLVTTADFKALQAANDALGYLEQYYRNNASILFGGLILNCIANSFEEAFVNDFARHTAVRTIGKVPRSQVVRQCELCGSTVMESQPESNLSYYYRHLANRIVDNSKTMDYGNSPRPISAERLQVWRLEWADQIFALENGLVWDGAAI